MRALTLVLLLAPAAALPARAESPFAAANALYRKGEYGQAAQAYQELLRLEPDSPALRYNLGNAYFKGGEPGGLGRAVAEYWRAWRLSPRDADIRDNLDFALRRAGESLVPAGVPPALHVLFHLLSGRELLGLLLAFYWLLLLSGAARLLLPARRAALRPWLAAFASGLALCACWWSLRRWAEPRDPAVAVQPGGAEARSGPGGNFPTRFSVPEGRRLSVLSSGGDWVEVAVLKEGLQGWVPAGAVERL